jgi:hypothetical protein
MAAELSRQKRESLFLRVVLLAVIISAYPNFSLTGKEI